MSEQVIDLDSTIMTSSYSICADLAPLRARGVPPACGVKIVVYSEVEVDSRALKSQLNLLVDVYCLFDGQDNSV